MGNVPFGKKNLGLQHIIPSLVRSMEPSGYRRRCSIQCGFTCPYLQWSCFRAESKRNSAMASESHEWVLKFSPTCLNRDHNNNTRIPTWTTLELFSSRGPMVRIRIPWTRVDVFPTEPEKRCRSNAANATIIPTWTTLLPIPILWEMSCKITHKLS